MSSPSTLRCPIPHKLIEYFLVAPQAGRLVGDILEVAPDTSNTSNCALLCDGVPRCLSFDFSLSEQVCILHDNIEGPSMDVPSDLENIYLTTPLQSSSDYRHFEKLGVGNSTILTLQNLALEHNTVYYINMRLRNRLGYTSTLSSAGILVDLTPPLPGVIGAANVSADTVFPGGCSAASVTIPGCVNAITSGNRDR